MEAGLLVSYMSLKKELNHSLSYPTFCQNFCPINETNCACIFSPRVAPALMILFVVLDICLHMLLNAIFLFIFWRERRKDLWFHAKNLKIKNPITTSRNKFYLNVLCSINKKCRIHIYFPLKMYSVQEFVPPLRHSVTYPTQYCKCLLFARNQGRTFCLMQRV